METIRYYFTGKPCRNGHVVDRYVSDGRCTVCKIEKDRRWKKSNSLKIKEGSRKYYLKNHERIKDNVRKWEVNNPVKVKQNNLKKNKSWYKNNQEKVKKYHLKRLYNITIEEWRILFESQSSCCAICKTTEAKRWHTDHCHKTGKVRGILCHHCNLGLGHFKDNVDVIKSIISYLCHE
jgi:hypothetical protein